MLLPRASAALVEHVERHGGDKDKALDDLLGAQTLAHQQHAVGQHRHDETTDDRSAHATGGYKERRADCERGAAELGVATLRALSVADLPRAKAVLSDRVFRRVRHVVTENERVLDTVRTLGTLGPTAIGDLMLDSHASMRDDFDISVPEIDVAVDAAVEAGALGARLTGGGFGGASIALVPTARWNDIAAAVTEALDSRSMPTPHIFVVRPSDGARRDEQG